MKNNWVWGVLFPLSLILSCTPAGSVRKPCLGKGYTYDKLMECRARHIQQGLPQGVRYLKYYYHMAGNPRCTFTLVRSRAQLGLWFENCASKVFSGGSGAYTYRLAEKLNSIDFSREVFVAFNQQGSSISGGAEPGTISFAKGEFVFRLVYYPPGPGVRSLDAFYSEGFLFAVRRDMLKKMTFETYRAPNLKTPIIKMTHVLKLHRSKRLNVQ